MTPALLALALAALQEGTETAPPPGGGLGSFVFPLVIVFAIFYFLVIRPEKKNRQRHAAMLSELKKGDKVVTTGGMYATVAAVNESVVTLQIADGVRAKFALQSVQGRVDEKKDEGAEKPVETK